MNQDINEVVKYFRENLNSMSIEEIEERLVSFNKYLDNTAVANLSFADLDWWIALLEGIQQRVKDIKKEESKELHADGKALDAEKYKKYRTSEDIVNNLIIRTRLVKERKNADVRRLTNEYEPKKQEFDDIQEEITEKVNELLRYAYLAGYDVEHFDKENDEIRIAKDLSEEMDLSKIYLTKAAAQAFNGDKEMVAERDRSKGNPTNHYSERFTNTYAYLQELVKRRNQLRNELNQLREKHDAIAFGDYVEGYDSFLEVDEIKIPEEDSNKELKATRDKLMKQFEKAVAGVNTYGDIMKMSLDDIRLFEKKLKGLEGFNDSYKVLAGSDREAFGIVEEIDNIKKAYRETEKVTENIKGIKNSSISRLRGAIKKTEENAKNAEIDKKLVEKEAELLKIQYILGLANDSDLNKFAKANKGYKIVLTSFEEKAKDRVANHDKSTIDFYNNELMSVNDELEDLKKQKAGYENAIAGYRKGIADIEAGVLNGTYESLIESNKEVSVGMKKLDELKSGVLGFKVKHDKDILGVPREGHTLDELEHDKKEPAKKEEPAKKDEEVKEEPKGDEIKLDPIEEDEDDKEKDVDLGDIIAEDDIELDPIEEEDKDKEKSKPEGEIVLDPIVDEDDELAGKKGDKMKPSLKERIVPKIKGKLPKAMKVLAVALGLTVVGGLVYLVFSGGAGTLLLTGAIADKVIGSGLTKKK